MRKQASSRLPERMVPRYWHRLEAMPINANGKIDRNALAALAHAVPAPEASR
jgi:pyochelin synthetase